MLKIRVVQNHRSVPNCQENSRKPENKSLNQQEYQQGNNFKLRAKIQQLNQRKNP